MSNAEGNTGSNDGHPPELNVNLPSAKDVDTTSEHRSVAPLPVDVLLLTVKDCEFLACYRQLINPFRCWFDELGFVYFENAEIGEKVRVALVGCWEGSVTPGGSLITVTKAVPVLRPKAVILVGTCSSLDSNKAKLGDVIISAKLKELPTGMKNYVSRRFLKVIKHAGFGYKAPVQDPEALEIKVHCDGEFLSGQEQVCSETRRKELAQYHPQAIGVETEGGGVFTAAFEDQIEWLIVKGIADYADGDEPTTERWSPFASVMAASVVQHILSDPYVFSTWPHYCSEDASLGCESSKFSKRGQKRKLSEHHAEMDKMKDRSELPEEVCNIHGHTMEVGTIVQALSDGSSSAVVLVSGIAGVGKSTVAIQAGHQLKNKCIVKFCSLRGAHSKREEVGKSESEVEGELREIMYVCVPGHQQTSENPRHVLLKWCRRLEYDMILILDNAEDAMEDQTRSCFIDLLKDLRRCSDGNIKFLITSRRSDLDKGTMGLNIKHVEIVPLDTKDSIEVLKDGAKLSSDSRPEKEGKLSKIAELCGNIPLALRLAGPLLSSDSEYTSEELIEDLENNPTTTLDLERVMEIAFEKLDKPLRKALVCLSVFVRSFDKNAAKALLTLLGLNCPKHLMKLKERCLIQKQDSRYLIHLLIRSFAKNIGETEEYRNVLSRGQQRFAEYFLSLMLSNSTKYWGKDTCKESFVLFNEERLNLETTLKVVGEKKVKRCKELEEVVKTCQQVAPYIEYCVPFELYYDFLAGILHFAEIQGKIANQVEILFLLYHESRKHGSNKQQKSQDLVCQAIKLHNENRQLFQQERLSEVFYLGHYGRYLSQDLEQREESKLFLKEAITVYDAEMYGARFDKARILGQLGHNAKLHEDGIKRKEALDNYEEALRFRQNHYGRHILTAFAHKDLADYYLYTEDLENAKEQYVKAIHVLEDMEILEQKEAIPIFKNFGICYQKSGKFEESRRMFERGSEIADTTYKEGNHKWKVWIKSYLAVLLYKQYPDEVARANRISKEVLKMGKDLALGGWPLKKELEKLYSEQGLKTQR